MSEQSPVHVAPKKRHTGLWFAGAVVVVAVGLGVVFGVVKEEPPVVDGTLAAGLLDSADFAPGFYVSDMTQDEMNQLPAQRALPDTINPPECSEFLRTGDDSAANQRVAAVEATDAVSHTAYVQLITPVDEVPDWDPGRAADLLASCGEVTLTEKDASFTFHISALDGVRGTGHATVATTGTITVASAIVQVDGNLVQFIGIAPVLDEAEFVRLANAAADRVRTAL